MLAQSLHQKEHNYSVIIVDNDQNDRMVLSGSLLRHYEQTLKEELERRKTSYNHDMCVEPSKNQK